MSPSPLARLAAALVSRPRVYDLVQDLTGQARTAERLRRVVAKLERRRVLDVGSAAGGLAGKLGVSAVCLDVDLRPLAALRRRRPESPCVAADGARLPFPAASFDLTLCVAVCHHVDDDTLDRMLAELARVTGGAMVLLEPLRNDARAASRLLWRYDRGRHARTREELERRVAAAFRIDETVEYRIYHEYWICVARPVVARAAVSWKGVPKT